MEILMKGVICFGLSFLCLEAVDLGCLNRCWLSEGQEQKIKKIK